MMTNAILDVDFINDLLCQTEREIFARITVLTQQENPIEFIEGKATGGSINVDGKSAIRRSCSLTLVAEDVFINEFYWGLRNKFKLEVGIKNNTSDKYEDIIWFPQGIFVITNFDTSIAAKKWTISIKGKDKMCFLNGEFGGHLPHNVDFGTIDEYDPITDSLIRKELPIPTILREAIRNYGNELVSNIIINDIEDLGIQALEYRGNTPMYLFRKTEDDIFTNMTFNGKQTCYYWSNNGWTKTTLDDSEHIIYDNLVDLEGENEPTQIKLHDKVNQLYNVAKFDYGSIPGYRMTDLTYPGAKDDKLVSKAGETVVSLLDKIKKMLTDFEYFYDLDGRFVFQRIKKYRSFNWRGAEESEVLYSDATLNMEKPLFSFLNDKLVTSFKNTPKLADLKNDFSIYGTKRSPSGAENQIHARYAIDEKPIFYKSYNGTYYITDKQLLEKIKIDLQEEALTLVNQELAEFQLEHPIENDILTKPKKLADGSWTPGWWDIRDWASYYKLLTNTTIDPPYTMKWYSKNDHTGYEAVTVNGRTQYAWLIIDEGKYWNFQHGSSSTLPSSKTRLCTKYESYLNTDGTYTTTKTDEKKEFMAPYSGCTDSHTYLVFLKQDVERNGNKVYFYNPDFPSATFGDLIIDKVNDKFNELLASDKIQYVDWREIIYQMALDYNKHAHDDDFLYQVSNNNIDYYPTGQTNYERYYTDLVEFWRDLYNPNPTPLFDIISYLEAPQCAIDESLYIQHSYRKLEMDEQDELVVDINKLYILNDDRCDSLNEVYRAVSVKAQDFVPGKYYRYVSATKKYEIDNSVYSAGRTYYQKILIPSHPDIIPFLGSEYCKLEDNGDLYFYVGEDNVMNNGETDPHKLNKVHLADIYLKNRGPFISNEGAYNIDTTVTSETYIPGKYYIQSRKEGYYLYNGAYDVSQQYYIEDNKTIDGYSQIRLGREAYQSGLYYELKDNKYTVVTDKTLNINKSYYKLIDGVFNAVKVTSSSYAPKKYYTVYSTSEPDADGYVNIEYRMCLDSSYNSDKTYYSLENPIYSLIVLGEQKFEPNKFFIWQPALYSLSENPYQEGVSYYVPQENRKHYYVKENDSGENAGLGGNSNYQYWVFKYPFGTSVGEYYDDYTNYAALQLEKYLEQYGWDNLYIKTEGHIKFQDLDKDIQRLYYKQGGILAEYLTIPQYDNYNIMKTNKTEITHLIYDIQPETYADIKDYTKAIQSLQKTYVNNDKILDETILNSIYQLKIDDFDTEDDYWQAIKQSYDNYLSLVYKQHTEILMEEILTFEQVHYKKGYYEYNRDKDSGDYWAKMISTTPEDLRFWFDFVNGKSSHLSKYSVQTIGARTKTVNDKDVKAIYYKEIPNTIFITSREEREKYEYQTGYTYIQLNQGMENLFTTSSKGKSAQEAFEDLLYTNSYATETATIQTLPIYHLQPNSCIYIRNDDSKINGEYLISKLSIPLDQKKMMSITATKVIPNII